MKKLLLSLCAVLCTLTAMAGTPAVSVTFPMDEQVSVSSYSKDWTGKDANGGVWSFSYFNNNNSGWKLIKCGWSKDVTTPTIISPAISAAITDVVFYVESTSGVNSAKLEVYNGANIVETKTIGDGWKAGEVDVKVNGASGYSYKLILDHAKMSSNGTTVITGINLFEAGQYVADVTDISNTAETAYTVSQAKEIIDAGKGLATDVYVKGIVCQVDNFNDNYKSITYWISEDGTTADMFEIYSGKGLQGADFTSVDDVKVGANVVVYGKLKKYNEIYEMDKSNVLVSYEGSSSLSSVKVSANAEMYNIAGQRVYSLDRAGLYIVNGKKVIVK